MSSSSLTVQLVLICVALSAIAFVGVSAGPPPPPNGGGGGGGSGSGSGGSGSPNPCNNFNCNSRGTCQVQNGMAVCNCSNGWTGRNCEIAPSTTTNPCMTNVDCGAPNGVCQVNRTGQAVCKCSNGFTGQRCEIAPNPCANYDCSAPNGVCQVDANGRAQCLCADGFSGRRCERAIFRSIDGSNNNCKRANWGKANTAFSRRVGVQYGGPGGVMRDGANARAISNAALQQGVDANGEPNEFDAANNVSGMLWQWGQFLDHDVTQTASSTDAVDATSIPVLDSADHLYPSISFTRDDFANCITRPDGSQVCGVREQLNHITAYIDASQVYGSDATTAAALRSFSEGQLLTSDGNLLPFDGTGSTFFKAGDIRVNEQTGLTATHIIFLREHNRLAALIAAQPDVVAITDAAQRDELIYQRARRIVGAEIQHITYKEFLPILIGDDLSGITSYDPNTDPTITNEFAAAAYRVGHTMLSDALPLMDVTDLEPQEPSLVDFFFDTTEIRTNGVDRVLRGLANYPGEEVDLHIADSVRTFLFGHTTFAAPGMDLAALNIQRGRDHGIPSFNNVRRALGMPAALSYDDITGGDADASAKLEAAYGPGNVNAVDLWVGGLAEPHVAGASVGATFRRIIFNQFRALKEGDSYFYEWNNLNSFEQAQLRSLAQVISDNSGIVFTTNDVFHRPV